MNSYGSIYWSLNLNFLEYKPFCPLKVGTPLATDTPAPVTNNIFSFFNIYFTASFMGTFLGSLAYYCPSTFLMGDEKEPATWSASLSIRSLNDDLTLSMFSFVSLMSESVVLTPFKVCYIFSNVYGWIMEYSFWLFLWLF